MKTTFSFFIYLLVTAFCLFTAWHAVQKGAKEMSYIFLFMGFLFLFFLVYNYLVKLEDEKRKL